MLRADKTRSGKRKPGRENSISVVAVADYRHKREKRKNVPDAGLAIYNNKPQQPVNYDYDPHLDPQLIWTGKSERPSFEVETVSLHIHERISTQAILKSVQRTDQYRQLRLFAEPDLPLDKRIEFYRHEMDWTNRLILGDSLLVMNSLLERELMAGRVQTIYMDPPYGIRYSSNFQPKINRRDVKDTDNDLTREPEQIQAYRDTWTLGIHSYLTYLRDRLRLCRELLHESGSIFVQINDENLHLVRSLLDEVFGRENFIGNIAFSKTTGFSAKLLSSVTDYLLWYARDIQVTKYHPLWLTKEAGVEGATKYRPLSSFGAASESDVAPDDLATLGDLTSQGETTSSQQFTFRGKQWSPRPGLHWKTTVDGLTRLAHASRIVVEGNSLRYVRFLDDYPVFGLTNVWTDIGGIQSRTEGKLYAVQTADAAIERCILMTSDPGDLVLDPTCGSGTTAHCAEKWGRRWITCDTSRVALAIARQRLMTARFEYYTLADGSTPAGGFKCETVPHVKLESIASNAEIDDIAAKHQVGIDTVLDQLNRVLKTTWKEWQVPREVDEAWPGNAKTAHATFWRLKREKRSQIDECIRHNTERELLCDKPLVEKGVVRVSGPFTVEAIPVAASGGRAPDTVARAMPAQGSDHVDALIGMLSKSGVVFPGGKQMLLENLRPVQSAGFVHAEGEAAQNGGKVRVAVSFGPRNGPITARQVDEAIRSAYHRGYELLVLAGFAFEPEAYSTIQKNPIPKLSVQMAHISPDVIVGAYSDQPLLKTTKTSQIFTVFGEPDVKLEKTKDEFRARLLGVDLYDPTTGEVNSSAASDIPAWFLDEDYDGYTFRICQAFFPKEATASNPWGRLENALGGFVDRERMEAFRGIDSLPFKAGEQKQIAIKVIDIRGNEVMVVKSLNGKAAP